MAQRHLAQSLHILGPLLGEKVGVKVAIGGAKAATDGNVIYLPALPLEHDEAEALGFGFLLHESNHVRLTDFSVEKGAGLRGDLVNILEDVRIDARGQERYPGARMREEALVGALIARGQAHIPQEGDPPGRVLAGYVAWRLTHEVNGIAAGAAPANRSGALCEAMFSEGLRRELDEKMFRVIACASTLEVARLADEIMAMLEDRARQSESLELDSGGGEASRGDAADANGTDEGAGDVAADVPNGAERPAGESAGGLAPQEQPGEGGGVQPSSERADGDGDGASARAAIAQSEAEAIKEAVAGSSSEPYRGFGELAAQALEEISNDCAQACIGVGHEDVEDDEQRSPNADRRFDARVRSATNALRQKLPRLLQAESFSRRFRASAGRRLEFRRLAAVRVGETRLFLQERPGISTETAVHLLLDRSSSMATANRIEAAREACYAAALALQAVAGVSVAATAFPGRNRGTVERLAAADRRVERSEAVFAGLHAHGGTPLAEAMMFGAAALLEERKGRRLLLVVTDGEYPAEIGRRIVERLAAAGIEAIGVGIACDCSSIFPIARTICHVGDLAKTLFELLEQALRSQRVH